MAYAQEASPWHSFLWSNRSVAESYNQHYTGGDIEPWLLARLQAYQSQRDEAHEQITLILEETLTDLDVTEEEAEILRRRLEEYIKAPSKFQPKTGQEHQLVVQFEANLAEHQAGYNQLTERKRQEQLESINFGISELLELTRELRSSPHLVDSCLKGLPIELGERNTSLAIDELIDRGKISPRQGLQLKAISKYLYGYSDRVLIEAEREGHPRVEALSPTLDAVGRAVIGCGKQSLREIYANYQLGQMSEQEQMLRLLVKSSLVCLNFDEAYYFYEELLRINPTADLHAEYAHLLQLQNSVTEAIAHYKLALSLYKQERLQSRQSMHLLLPKIAAIDNNLGILLQGNNELDEAQHYYTKALRSYRLLAREQGDRYRSDIAMTLNNLGNLSMRRNKPKDAEEYYSQALKVYEVLYKSDKEAYASELATTLNNLGMVMKRVDRCTDSKLYYYKSLAIKRELARNQPDLYLPSIALTLNNLATMYIKSGNLLEAEAHYEESLSIRRELAANNPSAYLPVVASTLTNLATLMRQTKRTQTALLYYEEAIEIYRGLRQREAEVYENVLAMTLGNLALLCAQEGQIQRARDAYTESLNLRKKLAQKHPEAYELDYVQTILIRNSIIGLDHISLGQAKAILAKYNNPKATKLKKAIELLEKQKKQ